MSFVRSGAVLVGVLCAGSLAMAGASIAHATTTPPEDTSSGTAELSASSSTSLVAAETTGATARIEVGVDPGYGTAAFGYVWVANHHGDSVMAIDPASNEVVKTIPVPGEPVGLAASDDSLWTYSPVDRVVRRIDPDAGRVVADIPVESGDGPLDGMRWVAGSMWFPDDSGQLLRIDPASNTVVATYRVSDVRCPASLAVVESRIWFVPQCGSYTLTEVDADTGSVLREVALPRRSVSIDAGFGAVWVIGQNGELMKVDPAAGAVVSVVSVGSAGDRVRVGAQSVFVRLNARDVVRVDPTTMEVQARYEGFPSAPIPGGGLVVTEHDAWVINFATGDVYRVPVEP